MSNSEPTININLGGNAGAYTTENINGASQVIYCPLPFPHPFPYPMPFPWPFPGGGPFDGTVKPYSGDEIDNETFGDLVFKAVKIVSSTKLGKEYNAKELAIHIKEDVAPAIEAAETTNDLHNAMAKVYGAYPNLEEFLKGVTNTNGGDEGNVYGKKKMPKWLKALFKVVVAVIELIVAIWG